MGARSEVQTSQPEQVGGPATRELMKFFITDHNQHYGKTMKKEHKELLCDIIDGVIKANEARPELVRKISPRTDEQLRDDVLQRVISRIYQLRTGTYRGDNLTELRDELLSSRKWTFMSPDDVAEKITLVDKKIQQREDEEKERKETIRFLENIADELSMIKQLEKL